MYQNLSSRWDWGAAGEPAAVHHAVLRGGRRRRHVLRAAPHLLADRAGAHRHGRLSLQPLHAPRVQRRACATSRSPRRAHTWTYSATTGAQLSDETTDDVVGPPVRPQPGRRRRRAGPRQRRLRRHQPGDGPAVPLRGGRAGRQHPLQRGAARLPPLRAARPRARPGRAGDALRPLRPRRGRRPPLPAVPRGPLVHPRLRLHLGGQPGGERRRGRPPRSTTTGSSARGWPWPTSSCACRCSARSASSPPRPCRPSRPRSSSTPAPPTSRTTTPPWASPAAGARRSPATASSLRANLLGFAVGEAALVHPNDRPGQGWYWVLSLQPGF